MKTAILYSGSAYNVQYSIKSQLENLVIPNDADVFVFTTRYCKRRKTAAGYIPDQSKMETAEENEKWIEKTRTQFHDDTLLSDSETQLIKDTFGDRLKIIKVAEDEMGYMDYVREGREAMKQAINTRIKENDAAGLPTVFNGEIVWDSENGNIRCVSDQYRHVFSCYRMMKYYEAQHGIKYDYVMRARIDFIVPFKFELAHYYLNHDAAYLYNCGGFRHDSQVELAEEFCWFSKGTVADKLFPQLHRMGTITTRQYKTIDTRQPVDMLFAPEVQYCLLLLELGLKVISIPIHRSATYTNGGDGFDYFNYMFRRDKINLDIEYKLVCDCETDINEHLPVLKKYAEECSHVTELGQRYGNSTVAFLAAKPKTFISYDVQWNDKMEYIKMIAEENGVNYELKIENPTPEEGESGLVETDLLFIDTNHHATQLSLELRLHADKVRKYIIMHDTSVFWDRGAGDDHMNDGMKLALEPFLANSKEWIMKERFFNNNGLMILERIN